MTIDEQIISLRKHDLLCHDSDLQIAEWLEELKVLREKAKGDKWYQQGRTDAECEYTSKVFERLREVDADYISIDHLIEVLEWAKEQLNEQN